MPTIFNSKDSIFFIGGMGSKAGDANAGGGATLEAWNDPAKLDNQISNVVGSNGSPLSDAAAWDGSQTACTISQSGGGKVVIHPDTSEWFEDCKEGLIANVEFSGTYDNGRYEVLEVYEEGTYIVIDLAFISLGPTCDVKVGGAFDELQTSIDNTDADAASPHKVDILTNKPKTYAGAGDQIDLDTGYGNRTADTWKTIIGVDDSGVELAKGSYVTFDVNEQDCCGFVFDGDNIRLKHLYAKDAGGAARDGFLVNPTAARYGNVLEDCSSTGCRYGIYVSTLNARCVTVKGGYYKADSYAIYQSAGWALELIGCVFERSSAAAVIRLSYYGRFCVDGCLIKGNGVATYAIQQGHYMSFLTVRNCIFYDVVNGIYTYDMSRLTQYNNICIVHSAGGFFFNRTAGSFDYSDYSCLWTMNGAPTGANRWGGTGLPSNSIEADPQFVNAASGDFRPRNPAALRGGKPDINGNPTQMGAILQKYQFGDRERIANMARLRIIR